MRRLSGRVAVAGLVLTLLACASEERPMSRSPEESPMSTAPLSYYVGTYTSGQSQGIYRFTLDPASGAASDPVLAVEVENPSFLALHPNGRFLYAVGEMSEFREEKTGAVSSFAVDSATGDLTLLNQQPSRGTGPCHLVVDAGGRAVLVANYGSGTAAVLPLAEDGRLGEPSSVQAHAGTGPNERRQEGPHAHGIALDAEERRAGVADLGADRLFVYDFEAATGALAPSDPPAVALEPGAGPRHVVFHPRGELLYSINELDSTVTVLRYDAATRRPRDRADGARPCPRASRARAGRRRSRDLPGRPVPLRLEPRARQPRRLRRGPRHRPPDPAGPRRPPAGTGPGTSPSTRAAAGSWPPTSAPTTSWSSASTPRAECLHPVGEDGFGGGAGVRRSPFHRRAAERRPTGSLVGQARSGLDCPRDAHVDRTHSSCGASPPPS